MSCIIAGEDDSLVALCSAPSFPGFGNQREKASPASFLGQWWPWQYAVLLQRCLEQHRIRKKENRLMADNVGYQKQFRLIYSDQELKKQLVCELYAECPPFCCSCCCPQSPAQVLRWVGNSCALCVCPCRLPLRTPASCLRLPSWMVLWYSPRPWLSVAVLVESTAALWLL